MTTPDRLCRPVSTSVNRCQLVSTNRDPQASHAQCQGLGQQPHQHVSTRSAATQRYSMSGQRSVSTATTRVNRVTQIGCQCSDKAAWVEIGSTPPMQLFDQCRPTLLIKSKSNQIKNHDNSSHRRNQQHAHLQVQVNQEDGRSSLSPQDEVNSPGRHRLLPSAARNAVHCSFVTQIDQSGLSFDRFDEQLTQTIKSGETVGFAKEAHSEHRLYEQEEVDSQSNRPYSSRLQVCVA
jgi:hypothetical protein